ncbi:FAD-linked oxidase [Kaistia algarum]|uniref:FAD-binding oxidoreductase n=1 Tax=Kaistia algarum TaxID=2083279 RepID=UPI000CE75E79|nr:FAD-binding oxidoreductase [Kaistia algarum]MCX5516722.1 FAD-binding oxidoreductase [Kaistia algarum]PPE78613.1 FAD-linked oxidase [Kaistia algarum]
MNIDSLKKMCKGTVVAIGDPGFQEAIHGDLWNKLVPDRAPQIVVKAADEEDIIAAVKFARANKLKVVVRGGGHNWCQPTLRNGGLLIDIQNFTKVISIDAENRRAVIQPIISNRDVQNTLNAVGLAFPTGHCPQVKASGYFLGGGMAWNPTVWGSGAESLEAIELVTAQGELIKASETENPDYFWAARGAGSGFFGVVTKYYLKLYTLPKAIQGSVYYYRLEDAPAIGRWLGDAAPKISPSVELSQFIVQAPPKLQEQAAGQNGWICMVTATVFENTPEAASAALQPLEQSPVRPLSSSFGTPLDFEQLFDSSGVLWPEGVRARVEATFSNHNPGEMMRAVLPLLPRTPSPTTVLLFTIFCGPNVPAQQKDMALSMHSKVYGGPWTMWWDAKDDAANTEWHQEMITALRPYNLGYYLGESDTAARPDNVVQAFTAEKWRKLCDLRQKYDPDRVFFDYFDGFASQ